MWKRVQDRTAGDGGNGCAPVRVSDDDDDDDDDVDDDDDDDDDEQYRQNIIIIIIIIHCALSVAAQCIVISPVCGRVCNGRAGCVCYHDNSKLRASIFTKLGL